MFSASAEPWFYPGVRAERANSSAMHALYEHAVWRGNGFLVLYEIESLSFRGSWPRLAEDRR